MANQNREYIVNLHMNDAKSQTHGNLLIVYLIYSVVASGNLQIIIIWRQRNHRLLMGRSGSQQLKSGRSASSRCGESTRIRKIRLPFFLDHFLFYSLARSGNYCSLSVVPRRQIDTVCFLSSELLLFDFHKQQLAANQEKNDVFNSWPGFPQLWLCWWLSSFVSYLS